jgi:hypothetical protein
MLQPGSTRLQLGNSTGNHKEQDKVEQHQGMETIVIGVREAVERISKRHQVCSVLLPLKNPKQMPVIWRQHTRVKPGSEPWKSGEFWESDVFNAFRKGP